MNRVDPAADAFTGFEDYGANSLALQNAGCGKSCRTCAYDQNVIRHYYNLHRTFVNVAIRSQFALITSVFEKFPNNRRYFLKSCMRTPFADLRY